MIPNCSPLDFAWADKRWRDPLTGLEVVRLSPPVKHHYRVNYFRMNLNTWDGQWMVFLEGTDCVRGVLDGTVSLVARQLRTGETRSLGVIPNFPRSAQGAWLWETDDFCAWAVARYSHRVNAIDWTEPYAPALIEFDIDRGTRRSITPTVNLANLYEPSFDATERYCYTPHWKERWPLRDSMAPAEHGAMMAAQPGQQDMVRIDLATGQVETIFATDRWWMGHPNPHPTEPDLFMCCQDFSGSDPRSKWGPVDPVGYERIRVFDIATRRFIQKPHSLLGAHEHWAPRGRRIYGHSGWGTDCHTICRNDLDTGAFTAHRCPPKQAWSHHVMIAPNEQFLVGDGKNDEEIVWKYELPAAEPPDQFVTVTPIAKYRALSRTLFAGGYRLETNAHVTPDSRWVVFQSSSADDWFEVWAARVPGTPTNP